MKKIVMTETQLKKVYDDLMTELLAEHNLLAEAQLDGTHAQELLKDGFKRPRLDALVEKFLAQDPNNNESLVCYYIRRFELIKKLDTRKKIEKRNVEDYDWDELLDFVDTRVPYYQKTILGKDKKHDKHD